MSVGHERQRLIDYLSSHGLDGSEIPADGVSEEGFKLRRPGANPETVHPWPEGFSYSWLALLQHIADQADYRRAGIRSTW